MRSRVARYATKFSNKNYGVAKSSQFEQREGPVTFKNQSRSITPSVLDLESLGLSHVSCMTASPNANRIYLGRRWCPSRERLSLAVASLSEDGKLVGPPRRYVDSILPRLFGARSTIDALFLDWSRRKLYFSFSIDYLYRPGGTGPAFPQSLSVYDLDSEGDPIGLPRSYVSGNPYHFIYDMVRHPELDVLYFVGWGSEAVHTYTLDPTGEPLGNPQVHSLPGAGKFKVDVDARRNKLYLGTYPDMLEVIDLDGTGLPIVTSRQSFSAGPEPGRADQNYFRFHRIGSSLYRHATVSTEGGVVWPLIHWPLDNNGQPIGSPVTHPEYMGRAIAADPIREELWMAVDEVFADAYTGSNVVSGTLPVTVMLNTSGEPTGHRIVRPATHEREALLMAVAECGQPVLLTRHFNIDTTHNHVRDFFLTVTVEQAALLSETLPATIPIWFRPQSTGVHVPLQDMAIGETSNPLVLEPYLKDKRSRMLFAIGVLQPYTATLLDQLTLTIEIWHGSPERGGYRLKQMTDTVCGNAVHLIMAGSGYQKWEDRLEGIQLLSERSKEYRALARSVAVAPHERPSQFLVSCFHLMGGQGHIGQLEAQAETVAALGFNTVVAYHWPGIPAATVDAVLDSYGLRQRGGATYLPLSGYRPADGTVSPHDGLLSYFDFYLKRYPADLTLWSEQLRDSIVADNNAQFKDIVDFKLADEPTWYYPQVLDLVRGNANYLQDFRDFLIGKSLSPSDFGEASWSTVEPIGQGDAVTLEKRRLYFWTIRFFVESASRGLGMAATALRQAFGHPINTDVNWNNRVNHWHSAHPYTLVPNNPDSGPDAASGHVDWLVSGRLDAHTPWSEDWFGDEQSHTWSGIADGLRCAAAYHDRPFGGYVVGQSLGAHPAGAAYKILSLVGRGAKTIDVYTFGPWWFFGDCWSERSDVYKPIADAFRLIGRAERVLYPARALRGTVAILLPGSSRLWDTTAPAKLYSLEQDSLHVALIHAGYVVDLIDDIDVESGELTARGYKTLYVVGPNVSRLAQQLITIWVQNGGTVVVTLGAAVADEFNEPSNIIDDLLGLSTRSPERVDNSVYQYNGRSLVPMDREFGTASFDIPVLTQPLLPTRLDVSTCGRFDGSTGEIAITQRDVGLGHAFAFGFFPGFAYSRHAEQDDQPGHTYSWAPAARIAIVAPAKMANTRRAVTVDRDLIEVCRLEGVAGIALVVLNWSPSSIAQSTITVHNADNRKIVRSAQGVRVDVMTDGFDLKLTLPIEYVDILTVE